jgi:spermidine synthase
MQRLFKPLAYFAVPAAAFLTFLLQPIVGKLLMPLYGGSAGTWMTISLFFQAALLAGYALAFWLIELPRKNVFITLAALGLAAPLLTKLPPWDIFRWPEWKAVLTALTLSALPAILLTTSIGLVLQDWIRKREGHVPYYLYGISNLGSVLALVSYPFWIEPRFGLSVQIIVVKCLLVLLGAAVLGLVWLERARTAGEPVEASETSAEPIEPVEKARIALWLILAFSTCTMMLGAIRILSAEIGSNPLAWLVPLGLYSLSFTLSFSGWWRPAATQAALTVFGVALFGYMLTKGWGDTVLTRWPRLWLVLVIAAGSLAGNGFVYQLRPVRRFSLFYLVVAIGGMLAGVFESLGAPNWLNRNYEFAGAAFILLGVVAVSLIARREYSSKMALALMLIAPPAWLGYAQVAGESGSTTHLRNYYGSIVLNQYTQYTSSSNETTLHGLQLTDPAKQRVPTTYYSQGSAAGVVIKALQAKKPALNIGVVGLGTGTLAAYARATDTVVFWDINPLAIAVARVWFTFLKDCPGHVDVRMEDGRIGIKTAPEKFDVLVIDAFSGDSIPMHLLTREAIRQYLDQLDDGILLVHVSNRYIDLFPVLVGDAKALGQNVLSVYSTPNATAENDEQASKSKYVLIYSPNREKEVAGWIDAAMQNPEYDYSTLTGDGITPVNWTDDRHAIFDVLNNR